MTHFTEEIPPRWSVLLLLLLLCSSWVLGASLTLDGLLLLSLKHSVLSDPLGVLSSWNDCDISPCSWNGVVCATAEGNCSGYGASRVISLILPNARLLGSIPGDLGKIEHLRHIDLTGNLFNGTIPSALFNASELRVLALSNNEISGEIPNLFGSLRSLQVVDLSDNALVGRIPSSLAQLPNLTVVSLGKNYLVGNLTDGYSQAEVVDFSSNLLNGSLPEDGFGGEMLRYLNLSRNRLTGKIPASFASSFPKNATVDLSFNNLSGAIPAVAMSLVVEMPGTFAGNPSLCGKPLKNPCSVPSILSEPPPNSTVAVGNSPPAFAAMPKPVDGVTNASVADSGQSRSLVDRHGGFKPLEIAGIVVGDIAGIGLLSTAFLFFYHMRKKNQKKKTAVDKQHFPAKTVTSDKLSICIGKKSSNRDDTSETTACSDTDNDEEENHQPEKKPGVLVTLDNETELELETLLKASAYIIGASGYSIIYKTVLSDGTSFAVRRIGDDGSIESFKNFEAQIRSIAKLRHPNVLRIRGFYWGSDEKLLISDFAPNGSLANISHHGKKTSPSPSSPFQLPWDLRVRITKGIAKALNYLHEKKTVHGNLKPSNILLSSDMDPILSDLGLDRLNSNPSSTSSQSISFRHFGSKRSTFSQSSSVQDPSPSPNSGNLGNSPYQAPECLKNLKPNPKWDVYSFGVVLLELLTGRILDECEIEEWSAVVFVPEERNRVVRLADVVVRGEKEETLVSLFRLAFVCVSVSPQKRPSMKDAVQLLDKIPP